MYTIAFIDRTNISLALPRISRDLRSRPGASRQCGRHFLLGIPGAPDSRRPSGEVLESEKIHQRAAGLLGRVRGLLRLRADVSRDAGRAFAAGSSRERCLSRDSDFAVALVFKGGAGARQRVVAPLPPGSRDRFVAVFGLGARSLELAVDVDRRRLAAVCVADHLARVHSGSSGAKRSGCLQQEREQIVATLRAESSRLEARYPSDHFSASVASASVSCSPQSIFVSSRGRWDCCSGCRAPWRRSRD